MTPTEALQQHQKLCDDLHQLALAENSFLQQHRRPPDADLLERKKTLLARLDETLNALRTAPRAGNEGPQFRAALDKARSRILQILQLDRENEQLLLRYSLAGTRPAAGGPPPSLGVLQKIYSRNA